MSEATEANGKVYPKSAGIYLLTKIHHLTAEVADLIAALAERDQRIAELEAHIENGKKQPG